MVRLLLRFETLSGGSAGYSYVTQEDDSRIVIGQSSLEIERSVVLTANLVVPGA